MGSTVWEAEFAEYFTARHGRLRRLACGLCGDWHAADDAVQHTFAQLYRHWSRVRPESLDAYARSVLANSVRSRARRNRREILTSDPPDSIASDRDPGTRLDLGQALARLPKRQREALVLRHLKDLSVAEVAALLGWPKGPSRLR